MTTILYVDDEVINLTVFSISFRKKYDVITAESAINALDILKENPQIDVVISDLRMPVMDGLEFIRIAKPTFSNIKFFILSGFEKTPEITSAIDEDLVVDYFKKPFNMGKIDKAITTLLLK